MCIAVPVPAYLRRPDERQAGNRTNVTRVFRQLIGRRLKPTPAVVLALLVAFAPASGQEASPAEYQFKAAFLYHFAQLVSWPAAAFASPGAPMIIGVLGNNPFGSQLEEIMHGKSVNGHPLGVKTVRTATEATNSCHILFIASSEKEHFPEIFAELHHASVLTVGETDHFIEDGGMINFIREGSKIHFQINDLAARESGLKIGSKLLSLASKKTT